MICPSRIPDHFVDSNAMVRDSVANHFAVIRSMGGLSWKTNSSTSQKWLASGRQAIETIALVLVPAHEIL